MSGHSDDARREQRRMRIFADGACAGALGDPPEPPPDLGSIERFQWFDGYEYKRPDVPNPYRNRSRPHAN